MSEGVVDQLEAAIESGSTDVMVEIVADGDRPLRAHVSATLDEREPDEDTLILNVKEVAALHDLFGRTLAAMKSTPDGEQGVREALQAVRRAAEVIDEWAAECNEQSKEEGDIPDERSKAFALACSYLRSKLPLAPDGPASPVLGHEEQATKELAFQAFVAGAEFAGSELEQPEAQFERHWEEQLGHAADAQGEERDG